MAPKIEVKESGNLRYIVLFDKPLMIILDYSIFTTSKIRLSFLGYIKTDLKDNISYFIFRVLMPIAIAQRYDILSDIYACKSFFANTDFILQKGIRHIIFCRKVHFKYVLIHTRGYQKVRRLMH